MKLEPGSRVAHYEITELIGKGGMGEVYRATDPRLPREVALKTSSVQFSDRFAREAKVIASLNHPNICTLFDVGPDFLVMEMIEGPTLSECIANGPMGVDEAVSIMRQVADALEYAHERGVIHRDLKPGNIKIRQDGVVKVLDFGLAKVAVVEPAGVADAQTIGSDVTETGVVLGTTAYMSPEQVLGKAVDRRADVWAFGVVFYELLTGARMHQGASTQEVMAAVLKDVPDLKKVPPQVRRLLSRCLEKDPNKRLRHVGDVMALLDDESPSALPAATRTASTSSGRSKKWLWMAIAALALAVVGAIVLWPRAEGPAPIPASVEHFEVGPSEGMTFNPGAAMTVSPNGRWMVFQANGTDGITRFWLQSLERPELRELPGTNTIGRSSPPAFWSFDSKWIVFASRERPTLTKLNIQGGPPEPIAQLPAGLNGASWNSDGVIIAGTSDSGTPILKVRASGGQEPVAATVLESTETNHLFPQFLPDEKHFLYLRVSPDAARMGIYIGDIGAKPEDQSRERLLDTDRQAYYAASPGESTGHLVFMRQSALMAQPFDPVTMKLSGHAAAIPGVERVDSFASRNYGVFSVSNTGTLAYRASAALTQFTWYDATGRRQETFGDPGEYANPAISPDGRRVAVAAGPVPLRDIVILDVAGARKTRFTLDPARDDYPGWSPNGKTIAFSSNRSGQLDLYEGAADSPGQEKLLLHTDEPKEESWFTKDGRFLLFSSVNLKTAHDIWALPVATDTKGKEGALVKLQVDQRSARVSPDGRWLAYVSVESGRREVWVRRFAPDAPADFGSSWQVSIEGGDFPAWRRDSRALYYTTLSAQMMIAEIDTSQGNPQPLQSQYLFAAPPLTPALGWDLSSDGKRFLFMTEPGGVRTTPFSVRTNWATALNK